MSLRVLRPGLLTTVQDGGRPGFRRYGVSVGGAADVRSLRLANLLVGNPPLAPALEMTLVGAELEAERDLYIAACGAEMAATVNGEPLPAGRTAYVRQGAVIAFRSAAQGCRTYLAVRGGIDVPRKLGGAGTDLAAGFGGFAGRALGPGDRIAIGEPASPPPAWMRRLADEAAAAQAPFAAASWFPEPFEPWRGRMPGVVRLLPGPEFAKFRRESVDALLGERFRVDPRSSRMGCRLVGPTLQLAAPLEMLSEPVSPGAVQVPPQGDPIVLMADSQTIGGYPRIAHVISADLPLVAQLKPGDEVLFELVDLAAARRILLEESRYLRRLAAAVALRE